MEQEPNLVVTVYSELTFNLVSAFSMKNVDNCQ